MCNSSAEPTDCVAVFSPAAALNVAWQDPPAHSSYSAVDSLWKRMKV